MCPGSLIDTRDDCPDSIDVLHNSKICCELENQMTTKTDLAMKSDADLNLVMGSSGLDVDKNSFGLFTDIRTTKHDSARQVNHQSTQTDIEFVKYDLDSLPPIFKLQDIMNLTSVMVIEKRKDVAVNFDLSEVDFVCIRNISKPLLSNNLAVFNDELKSIQKRLDRSILNLRGFRDQNSKTLSKILAD